MSESVAVGRGGGAGGAMRMTRVAAVIIALLAAGAASAHATTVPVNTSAPTITGTPQVREVLAASAGSWSGDPTPTVAYQWQRCGGSTGIGSSVYASTGTRPYGIAFDGAGNLYTANDGSHDVTRIGPGGVVTGSPWPVATGNNPNSIAVDAAGNVYTANYGAGTVTKITPGGAATSIGSTGSQPWGIAVDVSGNVYTANNGSVTKIPVGGGSPVHITGLGRMAGIVTDPAGNVYVTDYSNHRVHRINADGTLAEGPWPVSTGTGPYGLARDAAGNLYTSNISGNSVTKIAAGGVSVTQLGTTGSKPWAIALDALGNVYTANEGASTVTRITPAGASSEFGSTAAGPRAIAVDGLGNVYTGDYDASKVTRILACEDIAGATNPTYALQPADHLKHVRVVVTAANGVAPTGVAHSAQSAPIAGAAPLSTAPPTVMGAPRVRSMLAATTGTWSAAPAVATPAGYAHQWQRCAAGPINCTDINGATGPTYTAQSADYGAYLRVKVTATNSVGSGDAVSAVTGAVTDPPNNTALPVASGAAEVRATLTADTGSWTAQPGLGPSDYAYQWQRCGGPTGLGSATYGTTGNSPYGMVFDAAGNLYTSNYGSYDVTKIGVGGTIPGAPWPVATGIPAVQAGVEPNAIAIDGLGNLYTANFFSSTVTRIAPDGTATALGTATGSKPWGIAVDAAGSVYTMNTRSNSVTKFPVDGGDPLTLGMTGASPAGGLVDPAGNVFVANYDGNTIQRITPAGVSTVFATLPNGSSGPYGITRDAAGNLYTANIRSNDVTKIAPDGTATRFGTTGMNPWAIALDPQGNVYTANAGANTVTRITPAGVSSEFGTTGATPRSIAIDTRGDVYTANFASADVTRIRTCEDIAGATYARYTVQPVDYGAYLRVGVTASNGSMPDGVVYGVQTAQVAGSPPLVTVAPSVAGTASRGETLIADPGTWDATPAIPDPAGFAFQWQRCDADGTGCVDIGGAGTATYVIGTGDAGTRLRVRVTATNTVAAVSATSETTAIVDAPRNVAPPQIAGTAMEGEALTAEPGAWEGSPVPAITYQWQRCDAAGAACADIAGAVGGAYALTADDRGRRVRVRVTGANSVGSTSVHSATTESIVARPSTTASAAEASASPVPPKRLRSALAVRVPIGVAANGLLVGPTGTAVLPLRCPRLAIGGCRADGRLSIVLPERARGARASRERLIARFSDVEVAAGAQRLVSLRLDGRTFRTLRAAGTARVQAMLRTTTRLDDDGEVRGQQALWLVLAPDRPAQPSRVTG